MANTRAEIILKNAPWGKMLDLADDLIEGGMSKKAAAKQISEVLDETVDFMALIPGPAGIALETIDGPVIHAVVQLVLTFAADKETREARKAKRIERKKRRIAMREARKAKNA
tara:strand:+ start:62 stop:400 length:339 start_codon:yes stop_codon:yes gene_type:complete